MPQGPGAAFIQIESRCVLDLWEVLRVAHECEWAVGPRLWSNLVAVRFGAVHAVCQPFEGSAAFCCGS